MRLLDHIAQHARPFLVQQNDGRVLRLPGAAEYAGRIKHCPLRYVLSDDLTQTCTALAYSEGVRLADCLDLVHVPATDWWLEWNDLPRAAEFARALELAPPVAGDYGVLRTGVYVSASPDGRRGVMRSFWTAREQPDEPLLAPLETHFDLDACATEGGTLEAVLQGACTSIPIEADPGISEVLRRARYRFDGAWLRYYQSEASTDALRREVLHKSLGAVVTNFPVVIALLLLMTVRGGLPQRPADIARLNAKRMRLGRSPLLEHVELCSPVVPERSVTSAAGATGLRRAARFHHVRGHLVRRHNAIFWRTPHWRGHLRMGQVRTRTVTLTSGTQAPLGAGYKGRAGIAIC